MEQNLYGVDYRNGKGQYCNVLTYADNEAEAVYKAGQHLEKLGKTNNTFERVYIEVPKDWRNKR